MTTITKKKVAKTHTVLISRASFIAYDHYGLWGFRNEKTGPCWGLRFCIHHLTIPQFYSWICVFFVNEIQWDNRAWLEALSPDLCSGASHCPEALGYVLSTCSSWHGDPSATVLWPQPLPARPKYGCREGWALIPKATNMVRFLACDYLMLQDPKDFERSLRLLISSLWVHLEGDNSSGPNLITWDFKKQ